MINRIKGMETGDSAKRLSSINSQLEDIPKKVAINNNILKNPKGLSKTAINKASKELDNLYAQRKELNMDLLHVNDSATKRAHQFFVQ